MSKLHSISFLGYFYFAPIVLVLFVTLCSFKIQAQRSLISPAGALLEGVSIQLEGSIGEPVSGTFKDDIMLTQGFHQPNFILVSVMDMEHISFKIFPNPASNNFFIQVEDVTILSSAQLQIINMKGSVVKHEKINLLNTDNQVDISALHAGTYVVQIFDNIGQLKGQHTMLVIK